MPYRIPKPLVKRFQLTELDPSGDTYVEFKQATQYAVERRAAATESRTHILGKGDDQVKIESKFNYPEVQRFEAYLTMTGCNIEHPDGEKPAFKFRTGIGGIGVLDMNEDEFERVWGAIPGNVVEILHKYLLEVNPMWGFTESDEENL